MIVAQRHKRKITIFDKLCRLPGMDLARMDDIAGCRLIFQGIPHLTSFRAKVHSARFRHRRRNDALKYDYIANPKSTGYRGIHDVYEYDVNSETGKDLKGLYVELQYRTLVQHAWATTVEVIGHITESQPKFQLGDGRYERIMMCASEILARAFEAQTSCLAEVSNTDLIREFLALDVELGLLRLLRGLNAADAAVSESRNVILMFLKTGELDVRPYRNATDALRALFDLERDHPGVDMVLVRAATSDDVRIAFRNYFSDAGEFIRMVEQGCQELSGHQVIKTDATTLVETDIAAPQF